MNKKKRVKKMINETELQNMTKKEIDELIKMINEENRRREKLQYQKIVDEMNKLIRKADDLCMSYYANDEEHSFVEVTLNNDGDLVFEFWD